MEPQNIHVDDDSPQLQGDATHVVTLEINGQSRTLAVAAREVLADTLRDSLGLTGTKIGCRMANCGACTVHLDGQAVYSCMVTTIECQGGKVRTIEDISRRGELSAVQRAFVECDALQCGYCTPGQIMSLEALLDENPRPDREAVVEAMAGNLCRCGAYQHILEAADRAVELRRDAQENADES